MFVRAYSINAGGGMESRPATPCSLIPGQRVLVLTAIVSGNSPVSATCASRIFLAASCPLDHAAGDGIRYCPHYSMKQRPEGGTIRAESEHNSENN